MLPRIGSSIHRRRCGVCGPAYRFIREKTPGLTCAPPPSPTSFTYLLSLLYVPAVDDDDVGCRSQKRFFFVLGGNGGGGGLVCCGGRIAVVVCVSLRRSACVLEENAGGSGGEGEGGYGGNGAGAGAITVT